MKQWSDKKWARHGPEHSQWKGGRSVDAKGYIKLNINLIEPEYHCMCDKSGWILEHRYILAKKLGRSLTRKDLVHHIDHNIKNNSPENLELTTRSLHMKTHESWKTMRPDLYQTPKGELS